MEKEQQGHHHGDHHDGSDDAEHRLLTAVNVLFARGALVVSWVIYEFLLNKPIAINFTVMR